MSDDEEEERRGFRISRRDPDAVLEDALGRGLTGPLASRSHSFPSRSLLFVVSRASFSNLDRRFCTAGGGLVSIPPGLRRSIILQEIVA